jgi:GTP pyrophosphokinase
LVFSFLDDEKAEEIARSFSFKSLEELIVAVGYGKITAQQVVKRYLLEQKKGDKETELEEQEILTRKREHRQKGPETLSVEGTGDVLFHLSKCCKPLPGDEVVGYITRGRGITVHRADCPNIENLDPERLIDVKWDSGDGASYTAKIWVLTVDRKGMLASISGAISAAEANILQAELKTTQDKRALFNFVLEVSNKAHLDRIMNNVKQIEGVIRVERRFA